MGKENQFSPVKLFCGVIYKSESVYPEVKKQLSERFSSIDVETEPIPFDMTTYYFEEMGKPLLRRFVSFENRISPDELPDIKISTNHLEQAWGIEGHRRVNLDPGFISEANVIIATTKNHYHRVPLRNGIYAHMEYIIKKKKAVPLPWTYPDFYKPEYIEFFNQLRILLNKSR